MPEVAAEERLGATGAELDGSQPLGHAVLRHHRPGHIGGLFDVVAGTGRRVVEDQFLGSPAAHHVGELVEQFRPGIGVLVLLRQHHRVAQGPAARQDRHLLHGIGARQRRRNQGMPALVIGGDQLLVLVHQPAALLRPGDDPVDRLVQVGVGDHPLVLAGGQQCGLVEHVGQVGAGETRGTARHALEIDVGTHRLALGMHLEDLETPLQVRGLDGDLPIETSRAQQRGIQHVGPVGGGDQDDSAADVETVHLDQQLVQRLLALVVTAAHAGATVPADGVDLVDEDDGRGVLLGLLEQITYARSAHTDEHLYEVGAGDRIERYPRLAGDCPRQQGLAGAGRAIQQDALGDLRPHGLEFGGLGQELLDLLELLDRLLTTGDIGEGGLRGVLVGDLGLGLAELHHPAATALHRVEQEEEEHADDDERDQGAQQRLEEARGRVQALPTLQGACGHSLVQPLDQVLALVANPHRLVLGGLVAGGGDLDLLLAILEDDFLERFVTVDDLDDLGRGLLGVAAGQIAGEIDQQSDGDDGKDDPQDRAAEDALDVHVLPSRRGRGDPVFGKAIVRTETTPLSPMTDPKRAQQEVQSQL